MISIEKKRMIVGVCLLVVVFVVLVLTFIYKDTIFQVKINISYPDGCTEQYINGVLTTNECTIGRIMFKEQQDRAQLNINSVQCINQTNIPWLVNTTI